MSLSLALMIALAGAAPTPPDTTRAAAADTLRLEVGSKEINGLIYRPHAARVVVRMGSDSTRVTEWTNELTVGDSAGRPVMRWVTRGTQHRPDGATLTWEILQTYDRRTLAPLGYASSSSAGGFARFTFDGVRVRGTRKLPADSAPRAIDLTLDRPGFIASASDLIPLAAGLKAGAVMTAPVWGPGMTTSEMRIFSAVGKTPTPIDGKEWNAWKVEERRQADGKLLATWYLVEESPYMVYGEVPLPDGRLQRMTEVAIPMSGR